MNIIRFSDIEQFRNVLRNVQHKAQFVKLDDNGDAVMNRLAICPTLNCSSTVKIHGSNMSVVLDDYKMECQSRNNVVSVDNDCYGFARFIMDLPQDVIKEFQKLFGSKVVIFGEFAGKGIQQGVAVSQVDKFWAIFRVETLDGKWLDISNIDLSHLNQYRVYSVYQFGVETLEIDWEHPAESINKMNEMTLAVEKECPVGKFFGISSIGEGRVWTINHPDYQSSKYVWKVKGNEHSKSKVKKLASVDTVKLKSIEDFVERYVDNGRCQQAYDYLATLNKPIDESLTGDFLRWLVNDINKEESDTITANGLTPKEINGAISKQGRRWFFEKLNKNVGI